MILNAQFGCDSPASTAPPPNEPAKSEPAPDAKTAEPVKEPAVPDPTKVEPPASEVATPAAKAPAEAPTDADASKPVYMPASKSGGDFGSMQFPGQANTAPTPQQQAPQ